MKRVLIASLLALVLFVTMISQGSALTCAYPSAEESLNQYDAVFRGTALEIPEANHNTGQQAVTFQVTESWKGVDQEMIQINQDMMWGMIVNEGDEYLVYADKVEEDVWDIPLCSPTRDIETAAEHLGDIEAMGLETIQLMRQARGSFIIWVTLVSVIVIVVAVPVYRAYRKG